MSTTWWRTSTKILRSSERVYMHAWSVLYVQTAVNVVKTCGDNRTSCRDLSTVFLIIIIATCTLIDALYCPFRQTFSQKFEQAASRFINRNARLYTFSFIYIYMQFTVHLAKYLNKLLVGSSAIIALSGYTYNSIMLFVLNKFSNQRICCMDLIWLFFSN